MLYLAWALYPGEKRQMRNHLEDWWYHVTLAGESATTTLGRLLCAVAQRVERLLQPILGDLPTILLHSALVSAAVASLLLMGATQRLWSVLLFVALVVAAVIVAAQGLPAFVGFTTRYVALLLLLPLALWKVAGESLEGEVYAVTVLMLLLGAVSYTLGLRAVVRLLRLAFLPIQRGEVLGALLSFALAITAALLPLAGWGPILSLLVRYERDHPWLSHFVTVLWFGFLPTLVVTMLSLWPIVAFLAVLFIVMVHRVFWLACERFVYVLWEHGVLFNRSLLTILGLALLSVSGWRWVAAFTEGLAALKLR